MPYTVAAKPAMSQPTVRASSRGAGADSPRGWSSGDPTSSGRGCRPIEAWGDPGPPHLPISRAHPGSSMSGMWGWGRGWSKVAVFLCGLPSTRWAPCGLNTRLGVETQPKGRAGEGPLGCVECRCSGRRLGPVAVGSLGAGREGLSAQSPSPCAPACAGDPLLQPRTNLSSRSFLQLFSCCLPTALGGGSCQHPYSTDRVTTGCLVTLDLTILWGSGSSLPFCPSLGAPWVTEVSLRQGHPPSPSA